MLRRALLTALTVLALASKAASGDYERIETPNYVVENKSGTVIMTHDKLSTRVYAFISRYNPKLEHGSRLAFWSACMGTYDPKTCAAIAAAESGFVADAIGADGEISAWQLLDPPAGLDPLDNAAAAQAAMLLLKEKRRAAGGSFKRSIKYYNGDGKQAAVYMDKVLKLRASI